MPTKLPKLDGDFRDLIRKVGLAFFLRALGAVLSFGFNVAVGRALGAEGTGLYFMALALTLILSAVARLGLDNAVLRFVAAHSDTGDWGRVRGVLAIGLRNAAGASVAMALLVAATAPLIADHIFDTPDLAGPLRIISLGIVTFSIMTLMSQALKGLGQLRDAMLVSGVLWPLFGLIAVWLLGTRVTPDVASLIYVCATGCALLCGVIFWRRAAPPAPAEPDVKADLWQSARPLWVMAVITTGLLPWAPVLFLGAFGNADETGIFGAAARVANLVVFFLVAVNNILAPKFAQLSNTGSTAQMKLLARRFALLTLLAASPLLLVLLVAGDLVMSVFGPEFTDGATVLAILAIGQTVNAAAGSTGVLLMMSGNERSIRNAAILGAMTSVGLSITLIPLFGMIGAAVAAVTAVVLINAYSTYMIRKKLGFWVIPWIR